jgi:hypothetical protein
MGTVGDRIARRDILESFKDVEIWFLTRDRIRYIMGDSTSIWNRVTERSDGPTLEPSGHLVAEIIDRIEAGATLASLARLDSGLGLDAESLIAGLSRLALGPVGSEGPSLIRRDPPRPFLFPVLTATSLTELLPSSPQPERLALAAGLLQIFDFWDASHEAAQESGDLGETDTSAYWHGIAHRREPDPGNASYWFRRVGRHPLLGPLAAAARPILEAAANPEADLVVAGGVWDPLALVRLARPGSTNAPLARRLQRLEMALLLDRSARQAMAPR